jgi:hypothetical protein
MNKLIDKVTAEWIKAALIRAIRTMAQTALALISVGAAINEINWAQVASVSFVAGFASILTSLATKLPEVGTDGVLEIDTANPEKDIFRINLNADPSALISKTRVTLIVDPKATLSQEKPLL